MIRYTLQEEIGRGSFSVVYKAIDRMSGKPVAVKKLTDKAGLPKREVEIGWQITHPNVCRIFDYFESEEGSKCIAMEFVDGGNLRNLMEREGAVSLDTALAIAGQILDSLEAAHDKNIIHRDLKPENILLTSDNRVKLSDFGHARVSGTKPSLESQRQLGTPAYVAPEQAMGRECDARADIFAFGLILHELLSGTRPEPPKPQPPLPAGVPAYVEAAIRRCLEIDPSRRSASVSQVRKELSGAARVQSVPGLAGLLMVSAATLVLATVPVWSHFWKNPPKTMPPAAIQPGDAFSDGLYFLHEGLATDALGKFDDTISLDPRYPGAHYYRGLALAKLNRIDEAIEAFKRALPHSEPERMVLWSWDAPSTLDASPYRAGPSAAAEHGIIRGMDNIQVNLQRDFIESRKDVVLQKALVYGERSGKATVLYFLDLERHGVRRFEIPDEHIVLDTTGKANGSFTILRSDKAFYAFSADGTPLWHKDLTVYGKDLPKSALIGDMFYIYSPALLRFDLLDARTGNVLWKKEGFSIEAFEPPTVRQTKAYGDILIVKTQNTYRAIRKSDGTEAWTVPVESAKASSLANDRLFIVFEPERRIFTVDLETGKTVSEVEIEQYVDALPLRPLGHKWLVGALLNGNTLYVMSKAAELFAISVTPTLRILWHTPINKKMQSIRVHGSHLYLGTDSGELIVMDPASGAITTTTKFTDKPLLIDYAGDDAVLAASNNTLYGTGPLGVKNWEYPSVDPLAEATYFNGVITVYTSPLQMSALDVVNGKVLWQYSGPRRPYVFMSSGAERKGDSPHPQGKFFMAEESGVKEYAIRERPDTVTDKETLTELARAYQEKGDLGQARLFVDKAAEIDASYPPLALVRSRLLKAQGQRDAAGKELARYASLVGLDTKEAQQAIAEVKRDYGLLWETAISPDIAGDPMIIENRLVSVGRRVAHEVAIVALEAETGEAVWQFGGERYAASLAAPPFLWYASSSQADGALVDLYRIDVRSGERKEMASWHRPSRVDQAWITYESGRVCVTTAPPQDVHCIDAGPGVNAPRKAESVPPRAALWTPSAFLVQGGRLYAYTADGHAYAMRLN